MNPELKENYVDVGGDGDAGDEAAADTIIDIDNAVIGLHLQEISDLNAALNRIQEGVYGVCLDCGDDIDFERLSAYPSAALDASACMKKRSQVSLNPRSSVL